MMENFLEHNVLPINPQVVRRKYRMLSIVGVVVLVVSITMFLLTFMSLFAPVAEGTTGLQMFLAILIFLVPAVISLVFYFIIRRMRNNCNLEFDYTFVSGSLRIAKVINNAKRKPVIAIDVTDIEAMDVTTDDSFKRYETMNGIKKVIVTPNLSEENAKLFYIYCKHDSQPTIIIFEPSEAMVFMIKRNARNMLRKR